MDKSRSLNSISNKNQSEYLRRIRYALDYIEQNLDRAIQLQEVAAASYFSAYHFHRIFHAMVGETVNEYISRKRMERAIRLLMYRQELSITEVAAAGGYSSSANFAKSFRTYFGVSPSSIRNPAKSEKSKTGKLYRKYGKAFDPQKLYSQLETQSGVFDPGQLEKMLMQVKVEDIKEKPIAYLTSPQGYELDSVYATWEKIMQWGQSQGLAQETQTKLGICHDNPAITPENKCRYDAAIVICPDMHVTSPYGRTSIPAGKYAVAYYKDTADKISQFMTELCSQWLCNSGYEPDNYPPLFNYLNDSKEEGVVEMNVYIKLKVLHVSK